MLKLNLLTFILSCLVWTNILPSASAAGKIDTYCAERDEKALLQIARDNIKNLVSLDEYKEPMRSQEIDRVLGTQILRAFNDSNIYSKVCLHNAAIPVGFINYQMEHPWFRSYPRGRIFHLAVDQRYRGLGYGSALLRHAIEHHKEKSAKSIELCTIGLNWHSDLGKFYYKFGFMSGYYSKSSYTTLFKLALK